MIVGSATARRTSRLVWIFRNWSVVCSMGVLFFEMEGFSLRGQAFNETKKRAKEEGEFGKNSHLEN